MQKKASFVIPFYNAGAYLERCLSSVCSQSYPEKEVILINDGSTDSSCETARRFAEKYSFIRLVEQENGGVSAARNRGLSLVSGDYLFFVDADDYADKDYASAMIEQMEQNSCEMAVCGYYTVEPDKENGRRSSFRSSGIMQRGELIDSTLRFRDTTSALWNKCFLTDIIRRNNISFHSEYAIGEDLCFIVDYAMCIEKAICTERPLYYYLLNPEGAMSNKSDEFRPKQLTEWYAIQSVSEKLCSNNIASRMLAVKKVRIADKLLSCRSGRKNIPKKVRREMASALRSNLPAAMRSGEFSFSRKTGIVLNAIAPGLKGSIKAIFR